MRKVWFVWLGILAVVVIVVVVLARGGGKEAEEGEAAEVDARARRSTVQYQSTAERARQQEDDFGRDRVIGRLIRYRMNGEGWVSSVEPVEEGGWIVQVDVDPPEGTQDGAEVTLDILPEGAEDEPVGPGQKVAFSGRIVDIEMKGDRLLVWLDRGRVTPVK